MAKKTTAAPASPVASTPANDYTVLARRYRPAQFSELIGQQAVAQALKNAITSNRVAHAYLFTGARGVGKTSTARILAKCLNCVSGPTLTPCGACESCKAVAVGEDVDVVEIDGASNRNLDDVRELRANVQYRPQRSRFKIYIIDEVHMLTRESFNALLKTLEEPPPHVKFIFATTEANKVPITILSRCQKFDFGGISSKLIQDRLRAIVQAEKAEADPEALAMLARRAAGSMRDGQSLLDQALAFSGGKLTVDSIHALLGTANDEQMVALAVAVLNKERSQALALLQAALDSGVQPGELADQLIELWRKLMLLKAAGKNSELAELQESAREALARFVDLSSLEQLLAGLDILVAAKGKLRVTSHARAVLESAVLRLGLLSDLQPLASLATEFSNMLAGGPMPAPAARQQVTVAPSASALPPLGLSQRSASSAVGEAPTQSESGLSAESLEETWSKILLGAGPMFAAALGRCSQRTFVPPATVVLSFPRAAAKEREQAEKKLDKIVELFKKQVGQAVTVRTELIGSAGPASGEEEAPKLSKATVTKKSAAQHPLVKEAMEQLGAEMLRVDEGFGS